MKHIFFTLFGLLAFTVAHADHFSNEDAACGDTVCLVSFDKQRNMSPPNSIDIPKPVAKLTPKQKNILQEKAKITK